MRAVLLVVNPDLAALLAAACAWLGLPLEYVNTEEDLLQAAGQAGPRDVLLVDCSLARSEDLERCTRIIRGTSIAVHVIHPNADDVRALAPTPVRELAWLPPNVGLLDLLTTLRRLLASAPVAPSPGLRRLTSRQQEVVRLLGTGASDSQIAAALGLSKSAVKTHITRMKKKLDVPSRDDLLTAAQRVSTA